MSAWDWEQTGAIEAYMDEGYKRDYGDNEAVGKLKENLLEENFVTDLRPSVGSYTIGSRDIFAMRKRTPRRCL